MCYDGFMDVHGTQTHTHTHTHSLTYLRNPSLHRHLRPHLISPRPGGSINYDTITPTRTRGGGNAGGKIVLTIIVTTGTTGGIIGMTNTIIDSRFSRDIGQMGGWCVWVYSGVYVLFSGVWICVQIYGRKDSTYTHLYTPMHPHTPTYTYLV